MSDNNDEELMKLANQVSRSTVAVVDAVTQRGGFKGEELSTIGQLRDQAIQVISLVEQMQQEALNAILDERVKRILAGEADTLQPIHYDPEL